MGICHLRPDLSSVPIGVEVRTLRSGIKATRMSVTSLSKNSWRRTRNRGGGLSLSPRWLSWGRKWVRKLLRSKNGRNLMRLIRRSYWRCPISWLKWRRGTNICRIRLIGSTCKPFKNKNKFTPWIKVQRFWTKLLKIRPLSLTALEIRRGKLIRWRIKSKNLLLIRSHYHRLFLLWKQSHKGKIWTICRNKICRNLRILWNCRDRLINWRRILPRKPKPTKLWRII